MPCVDGHRGYREAAQPSASRAGRQAKWRWAATDNLLAAAREAADSDRALMAAFLLSLVRASAGAHRRPAGVRRAHKRAIRQNFGLLADSTALAWRGARGACRGYSQAPCCPTAGVAARLPAETWCGCESAGGGRLGSSRGIRTLRVQSGRARARSTIGVHSECLGLHAPRALDPGLLRLR